MMTHAAEATITAQDQSDVFLKRNGSAKLLDAMLDAYRARADRDSIPIKEAARRMLGEAS